MILLEEKENCCGCGACSNACPKQCIKMKPDEEGFLYPQLEESECINCGLCLSVCPIKTPYVETKFEQEAYIVQNKDNDVLFGSTAGGFFSALAEYTLFLGGIVFGAVMDEKLQVKHIGITDKDELFRFRRSKYVESDTGKTYQEAQNALKQDRFVCYSGTPCQIEGLKKYLGKEYDKLITCDFVCRAIPSPLIFSKYIDHLECMTKKKIVHLHFRDKSRYGYMYNVMTAIDEQGNNIYQCGIESDPYYRAFHSNLIDRPSCYSCKFKKQYRMSDFTMWDAFNVGKFSEELNDGRGATRLLVHTQKGKEIFAKIQEQFKTCQLTPKKITNNVKEMYESVTYNNRRASFFQDATLLPGTDLFAKYFPDTMRVRVSRYGRKLCYQLGIYKYVKKLFGILLRRY